MPPRKEVTRHAQTTATHTSGITPSNHSINWARLFNKIDSA